MLVFRLVYSSTVKMEAVCSSETSVDSPYYTVTYPRRWKCSVWRKELHTTSCRSDLIWVGAYYNFVFLKGRWEWKVSFTLYPRGKSPRYILIRGLGGRQSRSGRYGEENFFFAISGNRPLTSWSSNP
jgi:hypothetical protein